MKMGYFAQHAMDLLDGERTVFQWLEDSFRKPGGARCARWPAASIFRRRRREEMPGAVGRREGATGDGQDAVRSAELPGAGRATSHLDMATKEMLISALSSTKAPCCSSRTTGTWPHCPTGCWNDAEGHSPVAAAMRTDMAHRPRGAGLAVAEQARRWRKPSPRKITIFEQLLAEYVSGSLAPAHQCRHKDDWGSLLW